MDLTIVRDPLQDDGDSTACDGLGDGGHVRARTTQAGETYTLPVMAVMVATPDRVGYEAQPRTVTAITGKVMAVMVATPDRVGYEAQPRTVFPNLKYEGWQGSGHFLMMESPDRFNVAVG